MPYFETESTFLSFLQETKLNVIAVNEEIFDGVSISASMHNDTALAAKSVEINGEALRFFGLNVLGDFDTVKLAIRKKKSVLRHATQSFRSNPENALALLREFECGSIYSYFISDAKKDVRVCRLCFVDLKCGNKIAEAPGCIRKDKTLSMDIVKNDPSAITSLSRAFWSDVDILVQAYGNEADISYPSRVTAYVESMPELVKTVVARRGCTLRSFKSYWQNRDVVLLALQNGFKLCASHPIVAHFRKDVEVLLAVVKNSPECVVVFGSCFPLIMKATVRDARCAKFFSKVVKDNSRFVREVTAANWRVSLYFDTTKLLTVDDYMRLCAQPGALMTIFTKLREVQDHPKCCSLPKTMCVRKAIAALELARERINSHNALKLFLRAARFVRPMALLTFLPWGLFVQVNRKIAEYAGLADRSTFLVARKAETAITSVFEILNADEKMILI